MESGGRSPVSAKLDESPGKANGMAFSPNGKMLVLARYDRAARTSALSLWDVATQPPVRTGLVQLDGSMQVETMTFSSDDKFLATVSPEMVEMGIEKGTILNLWGVEPQPLRKMIQATSKVRTRGAAFSSDGNSLASFGSDPNGHGTLVTLYTPGAQPITTKSFLLQGENGYRGALSPDLRTLALTHSTGTQIEDSISLWDVFAQRQIGNYLLGHTSQCARRRAAEERLGEVDKHAQSGGTLDNSSEDDDSCLG